MCRVQSYVIYLCNKLLKVTSGHNKLMKILISRTLHLFLVISTCIFIHSCASSSDSPSNSEQASSYELFERIPSASSGIKFNNHLKEDLEKGYNIFDFDFFFNGSGVGIADFDNDGLKDVVFAANQGENRIFKNKGNFEFEDKTRVSKINNGKKWSTGVSIADVNSDGLLDIYISQGGPYGPEERQNLLFINKGNFAFEEQAKEYGLNDSGISSQAVFFDYDKDNDLDCFVLNESPLFGFDPIKFYSLLQNHRKSLWSGSTSHLLRNDNGKFTDITKNTDIDKPSFGLGVCVSDLNNDGWLDIYVANDYYVPDAIYINDKQGSFADQTKEMVKQQSFFGMGVDIADINNDGLKDIYVLDMASDDHIRAKTLMESMDVDNFRLLTDQLNFPYQYMFNSMQLGNKAGTFDNASQALNLAKTDWSWAGLMADFDLDGDKDIFVTNGYRKYAKDNDLRNKVMAIQQKYKGEVPLSEKEKLYNEIPSEKLPNIYFENEGTGPMVKIKNGTGLEDPSFSNGAAYADLDNDGDLDLVINNIDEEAFVYKNKSIEKSGRNFIKIFSTDFSNNEHFSAELKFKEGIQLYESKVVRGYLSSCSPEINIGLDNLKKVGQVKITNSKGKSITLTDVEANSFVDIAKLNFQESNTETKEEIKFIKKDPKELGITFIHQENEYDDFRKEILLPYKQSTLGPFITVADVNGDLNSDLYLSGASGQKGQLLISNGTTYINKKLEGQDESLEEMTACFFNLNNDKDLDLYIPSGGNSTKNSERYIDQLFVSQNESLSNKSTGLNTQTYSGKKTVAIDFDGDGDDDLFVANRMEIQSFPIPAKSFLYENVNGQLKDVTEKIFNQTSFGVVNDVAVSDFNNDGRHDLILLGEWNDIQFWENQTSGFKNISQSLLPNRLVGWWNTIHELDVNKDGLKDYVVGNLGLNSKYKANTDNPLNVYINDFDNNGSLDFVLSKDYKGKEVPFRGRECSSEQMPFISEKFKSYNAFANASMTDIFGEKLQDCTAESCNEFRSLILIQNEDGTFNPSPLPFEAQLRPILDVVSLDLNQDGFDDLVSIGNIYNTEPETPRLDYHNATVLINEAGSGFIYNSSLSAQLQINDNSKSMDKIKIGGKEFLIIGINNNSPIIFEIKI